jgi:hypothetical protein
VVLPALAGLGIFLLPFFDVEQASVGVYFRSRRGRALSALAAGLALIATPLWVLLDEFVLDWTAWLPTWPALVSNGLIPLAILLLPLILMDEWMAKTFKATTEERVIFIVTFIFVAFIILTVIGIFFRGPGMSLYWPWAMPVVVH